MYIHRPIQSELQHDKKCEKKKNKIKKKMTCAPSLGIRLRSFLFSAVKTLIRLGRCAADLSNLYAYISFCCSIVFLLSDLSCNLQVKDIRVQWAYKGSPNS